jgi:hypothetical protein
MALAIPLFLTTTGVQASSHTNAVKQGGTVTLVQGPQTSFTKNFSPFSGNAANTGDLGFIYEPLVFYPPQGRRGLAMAGDELGVQ